MDKELLDMSVWGNIGRQRSKFGKYLDKQGITQRDLHKYCKCNKDTITKACKEDNVSELSKKKLLNGLSKMTGKKYDVSDFW